MMAKDGWDPDLSEKAASIARSVDVPPDPIASLLEEFRDEYSNRRTVPYELLTHAIGLVEASGRYHAAEVDRVRAEYEERLRVVKRTVEVQKDVIGRLEAATGAGLSEERQRAIGKDGGVGLVEVTFRRDPLRARWWVSDLEEVAFRVRNAGGTDDTPVELREHSIAARVPDANQITLASPAINTRTLPPLVVEPPSYDYQPKKAELHPVRATFVLGAGAGTLAFAIWGFIQLIGWIAGIIH
jgi:hypothetical protein